MDVSKTQRALLVVSSLASQGRKNLSWLYHGLELGGIGLADVILGPQYANRQSLVGADVSADSIVGALADLHGMPSVTAVDLVLMVHGQPDDLVVDTGDPIPAVQLASALTQRGVGQKLRACYSTACFGNSHAPALRNAGFKVVCGAVGVNANSATEYPQVLQHWASGDSFGDCISTGDNPATRWFWDMQAKRMKFGSVNSRKIITGDGDVTIATMPN